MTRLRSALGRIAIVWLLGHTAPFGVAPAIALMGSGDALVECTCAHGDHAVCPMHHKPSPDRATCVMTGVGDDDLAVFSWLLTAGPLPAATAAFVPDPGETARPITRRTASLRPAPPDPPPPRV